MKEGVYFEIHICKVGYISLRIKLLATSLPQNHMNSLTRIQTQGSTAGLLNQSSCGQRLGICILNQLSRRSFYKLIYENRCIYFAIFVPGFGL